MSEIIKTARQEITQESKRSKIEQAKEVLRQISELEGVLADLYRQLDEIEG